MKAYEQFNSARKAGTPLIAFSCFDPESTIQYMTQTNMGSPVLQWDTVRGWRARNQLGTEAIAKAMNGYRIANKISDTDISYTVNEVMQLEIAMFLPKNSILVLINGDKFFDNKAFCQALWNLRDDFKTNFRTLVIAALDIRLPEYLLYDFVQLNEDLPDDKQLRDIIETLTSANNVPLTNVDDAVNALRGIPAFPAEQAVATNITAAGIDIDGLWDFKYKLIDSTPGLKVYKGSESFADIGGCESVKKFLRSVASGRDEPKAVVFIDEGEKMFAGAVHSVGDNTGVSQDLLATTLTFMEDNNADGTIFVGPPGTAKSAIAKAFGNEFGIPTIVLDMGSVKGSLVGESERHIRQAYKIIDAIAGGNVFFILTCNKDVVLPPELKRRFTSGTFFFDLPTSDEREMIWEIYKKKYGTPDHYSFDDTDWTGAEIRNCARLSYRQNIPLDKAADYIVPVAVSAREQVEQLRNAAKGRYLSANERGIYMGHDNTEVKVKQRRIGK